MLYIDFIDTETGKQVFEEGKIIEAQNGIIDIIQLRFNNIPKNNIQTIKEIASLQILSRLRQYAVTCQSRDEFIKHLVQHIPEQKWRKQSKKARRGTDEAFFGLMKVSGHAVLKLIGINPDDAQHYLFKSIVLKEKKLEPDIIGYPVLESNEQKVFIEFQAYEHPFIKYNIVSKALMACAQDNDKGNVLAVVIYTEQKYKDAALSINVFGKPTDEVLDHQIKELILTNYTLDELLVIDSRLIILAPFTVPTDTPLSTLTAYGRQWKKTIHTVYNTKDQNDAINVMSLFFLNRFRNITREEIKAMLDFDILDTVAGRQVYDEGIEKGREEGREEGLVNMREMLALNLKNRFGDVSYDIMQTLCAINDFEFLKTLFAESFSYDNFDHLKKRLATVYI
jgi:hypothetical protein